MLRSSAILVLVASIAGCSGLSNTQRAGSIGAAAGAVIGGIIGEKAADQPVAGVIIGAAAGGAVGVLIGREMDKQAAELEESLEGATVERVGEGIIVTFDSAILFDLNSSDLSDASKLALADLAESLTTYPGTDVVVAGHTDSSGAEDYNQALSERRASAAAVYLLERGVTAKRLATSAYGESQPVASNETPEGMAQNRRVEIAIYASEEYRAEVEARGN
jgi:outer membrane protein OmpA-like peptidoglycan-associated protein